MDTKLTLKLNDFVIEHTKKYAASKDEFEISPFVRSISTGKSIPAIYDHKNAKEEYIDFLDKKYQ